MTRARDYKIRYELARRLKRENRNLESLKEFKSILSEFDYVSALDKYDIYGYLAYLYLKIEMIEDAEFYAREALRLQKDINNKMPMSLADSNLMLARVLAKRESYIEAHSCLKIALPIYERILGQDNGHAIKVKDFMFYIESLT